MSSYRAMRREAHREADGFTLVEMAMVLMIVALLLGGLLPTISSQVEQRQINETRKQLDEIQQALIGFAVVNGRLPRPATSAINGDERAACTTTAACIGFIPWATLGSSKLDSWGKIIRYGVAPVFAGDNTGTTAFTLSTTTTTKTIQTRDSTGALITLANQVPAVIFSHGKNNWGTDDSGNAFADSSTTNADEDTNNASSTNFISRINSGSTTVTGGEFDDLVIWLSPNILFNRMVAAGKLP